MKNVLFFLACFGLCFRAFGMPDTLQPAEIKLINPSFEGAVRAEVVPVGWYDCGFAGETPPDTQGEGGTIFGVNVTPKDGYSCLGLVTRDNATRERVAQELKRPMLAGVHYQFSLYLTTAPSYLSPTKASPRAIVNFRNPTIVRIWGCKSMCEPTQLLATSAPVVSTKWEQYEFVLSPKERYEYIMIEAYYANENQQTNGHILVDLASSLVPIRTFPATANAAVEAPAPTDKVDVSKTSPKYIAPDNVVSGFSEDRKMLFVAVTEGDFLEIALTDEGGQVLQKKYQSDFNGSFDIRTLKKGKYHVWLRFDSGYHTIVDFEVP